MKLDKIVGLMEKSEIKLFEKNNVNFLARIYFGLIDDILDSNVDNFSKQQIISKYVIELDKIYKDSLIETEIQKTSMLTSSKIEKYSILKYFFRTKNDFMIEFMSDAILNDYNSQLNCSFEVQEINIINILTKEKIELNKKQRKLLLKLLSNLIKAEQSTYDYSLAMKEMNDNTECIIANSDITKIK